MATTVYQVDGNTRIILAGSQWGIDVLNSLRNMGHTVETTDQDPDSITRSAAELARRDALLDSTGL